MVLIVFKGKGIKNILWGYLILLSISMILAGIIIFTCSKGENMFVISNVSYKNTIISIMLTYLVLCQIVYYLKDKKKILGLSFDVEINTRYGCKNLKCFLDTGNNLKEPITKTPVIIVNCESLKEFKFLDEEFINIRYSTVGGNYGEIKAFKPDSIILHRDKKEYEIKAFIGLIENKLSLEEEYEGLLPRGLMIDGGVLC